MLRERIDNAAARRVDEIRRSQLGSVWKRAANEAARAPQLDLKIILAPLNFFTDSFSKPRTSVNRSSCEAATRFFEDKLADRAGDTKDHERTRKGVLTA